MADSSSYIVIGRVCIGWCASGFCVNFFIKQKLTRIHNIMNFNVITSFVCVKFKKFYRINVIGMSFMEFLWLNFKHSSLKNNTKYKFAVSRINFLIWTYSLSSGILISIVRTSKKKNFLPLQVNHFNVYNEHLNGFGISCWLLWF
jgi:hypothetical protein